MVAQIIRKIERNVSTVEESGAQVAAISRAKIAICYPSDPVGCVPGGVDSFIRGILRWAPPDLTYTLIGATSDPVQRPVGEMCRFALGGRNLQYLPIVTVDARARRNVVPLTARYLPALWRLQRAGVLAQFDIFDFHRIEPILLVRTDPRPKNVFLHTDMAALRNQQTDILWRHFPAGYDWLEGRMFRSASHVYCVRQSAIDRYQKNHPAQATKFEFIPTWVDTNIFYPLHGFERQSARQELRARLGIPAAAKLAVFVGRLDHSKDPQLLLESFGLAAAQDELLHLAMIGDGSLRGMIADWCGSNEAGGRVHLLGTLSAADIAGVLQASDVFLLSSAYEGMPMALLEALATGLPVVATDVGEIKRLVVPGLNGALVGDRSPSTFARALGEVLVNLQRLSGKACVQAVAPYRPNLVLNKIYGLHRSQVTQ